MVIYQTRHQQDLLLCEIEVDSQECESPIRRCENPQSRSWVRRVVEYQGIRVLRSAKSMEHDARLRNRIR